MLTHHQLDSQDNEFSHDITGHIKSEDKAQRQRQETRNIPTKLHEVGRQTG